MTELSASHCVFKLFRAGLLAILAGGLAACTMLSSPQMVAGAACSTPPVLHCPDADCPLELFGNLGNATDSKTGRQFFLDYPCDIKPGEKLTFILNLHGGGSIGNWQRHYFPAMDYKDKYRLIVATPSGVVRAWIPANDDEHLKNIVDLVYDQFGDDHIGTFWLAGHSQGGQTSNRLLVENDFIRKRLTGWLSLSGGRLGSPRSQVRTAIPAGTPPPVEIPTQAPARTARGAGQAELPALGGVYPAENLPDYHFSHIYVSGEHELPESGLPDYSLWAQALGCRAQQRSADVVDTRPGYVYDTREQAMPNPVWGGKPGPGRAEVFVYPACEHGLMVADIIRMDKGHTEGLEPAVTEKIIQMMLAAGK